MDDLVFKNIPAEGFDALSATDRASNPTPSKLDSEPVEEQDEIMTFSLESQLANLAAQTQAPTSSPVTPVTADPLRLSNTSSPLRQQTSSPIQESTEFASIAVQVPADQGGRASNPTVTRESLTPDVPMQSSPTYQQNNGDAASRRASNPTPSRRRTVIDPPIVDAPEIHAPSSIDIEANSRASNPTPTRRSHNGQDAVPPFVPEPTIPVAGMVDNRPSNPTPRRRGNTATVPQTITVQDISIGTPIPVEISSRASNPTPTRRGSASTPSIPSSAPSGVQQDQSSSMPSMAAPVSDSRASNPTPTRRGTAPAQSFPSSTPSSIQQGQPSPVPSTAAPVSDSRASNPTPTRIGMVVPSVTDDTANSSFGDDNSRLSNPSTTRR